MILGLIGKKQVGKDTIANYLVNEQGFTRLAFADALKEDLLELDPIIQAGIPTVDDCDLGLAEFVRQAGWEEAKREYEVRRLLQRFGDVTRKRNPYVWVDALVEQLDHSEGDVVITDIRRYNEALTVDAYYDSQLVRVVRGSYDTDTHISETELDDLHTDYIIDNNGDLTATLQQVDRILGEVRG